MPSPVKRQTQIDLDLGELCAQIQSSPLVVEDQPETLWFDIRSDMEGPFLACRVQSNGRQYAFRVPVESFSGDTSSASFPADFTDLQIIQGEGRGMLQFGLPCVSLRKKDDAEWKRDVGAHPYDSDDTPFPTKGPYTFDQLAVSKVHQLLLLSEVMGIREPVRIRYHKSIMEVYTTDTARTIVAEIPVDAPNGLWDVAVPREVLRKMSSDVVIDHAHGFGLKASDGKTFSFSQEGSKDFDDYSFDVPGVSRAVVAFNQSFPTSPAFWEAVGKSGYHLVDLVANCAKISKIDPSSVSFHSPKLVTHDPVEVSINYRGAPAAFILDASQIVHLHGEEIKIHVTSWPCSPYVVDDQILKIVITPPALNPGALAASIQDIPEWEQRKSELADWVGDYDRAVLGAFIGDRKARDEAGDSTDVHGEATTLDEVFLYKTASGFVYRGGVGTLTLSTCLFEFAHAAVYPLSLIEEFLSGDYWPNLQVYVYDRVHNDKHGPDPKSPYGPDWVLWETWVDPDDQQVRDGSGNLKPEETKARKRQVRILESSLSAPEITGIEPAQNPPPEPISSTGAEVTAQEESEVIIPEVVTEEPIKCLFVDANYVTWRDFYQKGLAGMQHPTTGHFTGVAFGFIRSLRHWVQLFRPASICVVWDGGVSQWRRAIIADYKDRTEKKKKIPPDKMQSMFLQRDWLALNLPTLGVRSIQINGHEADDIIALLADSFAKQGRVMIVTGDHDFNHLITPKIHVYQDRKNEVLQDPAMAAPSLLRKVIEGDTSDKIPGVNKVGKKTLDKLIAELTEQGKTLSLESIMETAPDHDDWRIRELVKKEAKVVIDRNLELIDLRKGVAKIDPNIMVQAIQGSLAPAKLDITSFGTWAQELAFNSVLNDISGWQQDFSRLT